MRPARLVEKACIAYLHCAAVATVLLQYPVLLAASARLFLVISKLVDMSAA